ncbi:MAG: hypothetical protein ABW220_07375, partial [Burkholderiaceae bacterium]
AGHDEIRRDLRQRHQHERALVELAREQEHARRVKAPPPGGRVTAVRTPKPEAAVDDADTDTDGDAEEATAGESADAPPRKRRRRRRKPAGQREGGDAALAAPAPADDPT